MIVVVTGVTDRQNSNGSGPTVHVHVDLESMLFAAGIMWPVARAYRQPALCQCSGTVHRRRTWSGWSGLAGPAFDDDLFVVANSTMNEFECTYMYMYNVYRLA